MGEQAASDDARQVVDLRFHGGGVGEVQAGDVDDGVVVVGEVVGAPFGGAAEADGFAGDEAARHWEHLDWERESAQAVFEFGVVDDADEFATGLCDDLFARQRTAAAFDEAQVAVGFVGAVNVERECAGLVELKHTDAGVAQGVFGGDRAGDGAVYVRFGGDERLDEEGDGRAGADADDIARLDVAQRGFSGFLFERVHRCADNAIMIV